MSVYVLAHNGVVQKYPYSLTDMRFDNSNVSFPADISNDIAAEFNTFPVAEVELPAYDPDTQMLVWVDPIYADNIWMQQWRVDPLSAEEIAQRLEQWRAQTSCAPFQGRMALNDAGLLSNAQAIVDAADEKTKVAWEYALIWERTSPMIASLAQALGLSDTEVDSLFKAAQEIQA